MLLRPIKPSRPDTRARVARSVSSSSRARILRPRDAGESKEEIPEKNVYTRASRELKSSNGYERLMICIYDEINSFTLIIALHVYIFEITRQSSRCFYNNHI